MGKLGKGFLFMLEAPNVSRNSVVGMGQVDNISTPFQ